jgi:cytochrome c oxidase assembly protein subunit 15
MIGRILGLVFIIPFIYFIITKQLNKKLIIRTSILLLLGSSQAFLGWWMVKSGLIDKPDVSHFRLAAHLTTAFITFSYTFWIILTLIYPNKKYYNDKLFKISISLVFLLLIQIVYGAFVAGLEAGKIYNTWPKMNEKWIAESVYAITPIWKNFTEGLAGIQFVHRTLAFIILILVIYFYRSAKKINLEKKDLYAVNLVTIFVLLQIFFGILALINSVPIWLGSIHQILAFLLLASSVYCVFIFKKTV